VSLFTAAILSWQAWGWVPEQAHAHEALARVLSGAGDPDGAAVHEASGVEIRRAIRAGEVPEAAATGDRP
jgi:hypothetical protein